MYDTITPPARAGLHTAVMAAVASVPEQVKNRALSQVTAYTVQAELSSVVASKLEHAEEAAKWACIARENGASEHQITDAEQDGHDFIARFGDDGA